MKFSWRLLAVCFWVWMMMMTPLSSKPHPSLLKKLEKLEEYQKNSLKQYRGIHISKPDVPLPVKQPAEILAIEEEEAIIMQYAVTNLLDFANISIKLLPRLIRICSETTVGVFSAVMLGIGSVFNLVASSIQSMSHRLASTQHDPVFKLPRRADNGYSINPYYSLELNYLQNLSNTTEQDFTNLLSIDEPFSSAKCLPLPANMSSSSLMKTKTEESSLLPRFFMYRLNKSLMKFHFINSLNHSAKFFYGFSEALALTGEVTEAITLGLGEAIEDSFHHLQILSYLGQQAVDFMLINEIDAEYEQELIRQRHQNLTASKLKLKEQEQLIENRPDFIIVDESNESKTKQPTATDEEEENDPTRKKPRKIYIKPNRDRTISATESQNRKKISSSKGSIPNNPLISMNTADDTSFYSWLVNFLFNAMQYEKRLFEQSYDQFSYYASKTWDGVSLMIRNCVEIILYSLEIPSITFHLTFAFCILLLLVILPFPTKQAQIYLITCVMIFFWIVIMAIEYTQRYRLIERVRIETMESYLQENMPKVFYNLSSIENMTPSPPFQQIPSISSANKDSPENLDTSTESPSTSTSGSSSSEQSTFSVNLSKEYSMLLNQLPFFPTSSTSSSSASPSSSSSSPSSPPGIPTMTEIEQIIASQKMIWFNTLLSLTWNILDDDFYNSGIGGYMSETYEELLNIELERIHETTQGMIRAIKLKKFHFGTNPPLMKSISTNLYRNATCVNQLVFQYAQQQTEKKNKLKNQQQQQHDSSYLSFLFPSTSSSSSNEKRMRNHNKKDFLKRLKNYVSHSWNISKFISNEQEEMIYEFSEQITDYLFENLIPSALQQQPQQPQSTTSSSSFSSSKNDPYSSGSSSDTSPLSATAQKNKYVKQTAFFISCDTLIIDVNMVYVSKDMDIIISLRTEDIKSMIPEFTVTLSELIFDGWIRFKIQLTNDYPFFGNTTMSFLQLPQLDFTVNSFGGVDISTIPYAFHFVNSSLYAILEEYTEPHSMEIDLRHTLCPTCDQVAPRLFTIENILQDTLLTTKRMYQSIWRKGMSFVSEKVGKFMNFWKSGKWKNIFSFGKKKKLKTRIDDEYYWDHSYAN